jgi:alginate O-acetyltransferase complex protein AlgI
MLFNSLIFPVFFLVVLLVYYRLSQRWQNRWLLLASYFFYGWWDWRFCSLLIYSTVQDWFISKAINKTYDVKRRKLLLSLSMMGNLGLLGFFKYFNFFASSAQSLINSLGFHADIFTLNILLPVGISFYTFQTMAYTIDVYRKKQEPADNFTVFALYVSFFPQLVAGPIERARRLLPQFTQVRKFNYSFIRTGIPLILFGYFKKVVIADSLAPIVQSCFQNPGSISGPDLLFGVYAFAIQIYCDFSGYTDIARGVARFLGINLIDNFSAPYFSRNITEFWRRWHISLSLWLKDYLYISLGGNRRGKNRTYLNLMITMLLGGLWHGAAWTYVIWGGLHGMYLSIHKIILKEKKNDMKVWGNNRLGYLGDFIKMVFTFHLVCIAWIFFRAPTLDIAIQYITGIFVNSGNLSFLKPVFLAGFVLVFIDIGQYYSSDYGWLLRMPVYWRYVLAGVLFLASALVFGSHYSSPSPFIYFQF